MPALRRTAFFLYDGNGEIIGLKPRTGATTSRPTGQPVGAEFYDTTLHKPIWWDGSAWRDASGTIV